MIREQTAELYEGVFHSVGMSRYAFAFPDSESHIRVIAGETSPTPTLIFEAPVHGIVAQRILQMLEAFSTEEIEAADRTPLLDGNADPVEALSRRELEVLQRIAQGLTNDEVGERLFISMHTVKTHTRSIYAKLDVHSRTEAVHRARALGLLQR